MPNMEGLTQQENFEIHFSRLQKLWEILKEKGFRMMDLDIIRQDLEMGIRVPIVYDGACGARASYSHKRGLIIWYTNGFENPDNTTRQEIESLWSKICNP